MDNEITIYHDVLSNRLLLNDGRWVALDQLILLDATSIWDSFPNYINTIQTAADSWKNEEREVSEKVDWLREGF